MGIDHRADAERVAKQIPRGNTAADAVAFASEATAHALLAVEARLGELVEQQRIANIIAALGTDGEDGLIYIEDQAAAELYVREHISGLVNPDSESEPA